VRTYKWADIAPNGVKDWAAGASAVVIAQGSGSSSQPQPVTILSSGLAQPWTPNLQISPAQTVQKQWNAVERDATAPVASAHVVLASKAGTGLTGAQTVLNVLVAHHESQTIDLAEHVVPIPAQAEEGKAQLAAALMSGGVIVATLTWVIGRYLDAKYYAHRVAFSSKGQKLWERTDNDNRNNSLGADTTVLPCLTAEDLTADGHTLTFGVDDQFVGVELTTGKELYRTKGPYSGGLALVSEGVFGIDAFRGGGYGNGISLFRGSDGTSFGITSASSVAVDPVTGHVAAAYTITDGGTANTAPNTPGTPALQVVKPDGSPGLVVTRDQAASLGQPQVVRAFDGRMIVSMKDGIRVVSMADGTAEPGFESVPPGTFRLQNVPLAGGPKAVVLGQTNGYGETKPEFSTGLVLSDQPLSWRDLKVRIST